MSVTTFSSREFNHDTSGVKRAVTQRPVVITDRGEPAQVPFTTERHKRLATSPHSIIDLLGMSEEIEFEPPTGGELSRQMNLG